MKNIYVAGPMKGYPEKNYPLFNSVTKALRDAGFRVYNPAEFPYNGTGEFDLRKAFAAYSNFICLEADRMILLPGWQQSQGAYCEYQLAVICQLRIHEWGHYPWTFENLRDSSA